MNLMFYLFIYCIMVYGVCNAFVYFNGPFNIIDNFRNWIGSKNKTFEELFSCMFCLPTNVGLILSIISLLSGVYFTPFNILFCDFDCIWPLTVIFDGFFTGGVVYLIHTIQQRIEGVTSNNVTILND